jgi:hypothetical protein
MAEEIVLACDLNRDFLLRGSKNEKIVLRLSLYTHPDFVRAHPATHCDVLLVVDTSSSMNEPFAPGAKQSKRLGVVQALETILPAVQAQDTVSLVCYDSGTYVEFDHVPGSDQARLRGALPRINQHTGATNFEKAFAATRALLGASRNASRKVCFLTDGNATEGNLALAHQINRELAAAGATVDCLGVGQDFNFNEMQRFTGAAGGRTELLDTPNRAGEIFRQLLQAAQRSLVGNAVLRLALPAGMRDVEIYQLTPEVRFFDDVRPAADGSVNQRINLQTVTQTHTYTFLLQAGLDLPADPNRPNVALARVRLDYDVPVKNLRGQVLENEIVLNLAASAKQEVRDTTVDNDFLEASLEKLDQEVNRASQRKDWTRAGVLLHEMAQKARKLGDDDKAREYQRRLDTLRKNGCLSQDDLNWIGKTSTRSARLRSGEREADNRGLY